MRELNKEKRSQREKERVTTIPCRNKSKYSRERPNNFVDGLWKAEVREGGRSHKRCIYKLFVSLI